MRVGTDTKCSPVPICKQNEILDLITNTCVIPPAQPCPSGQYRDINDQQCHVNVPADKSCPSGMSKDVQGFCVVNPPLPSPDTNYDGSTDYDGNPDTSGTNEPGRPGSGLNKDGTPDTDGNPNTNNDSPQDCVGVDCNGEPTEEHTCYGGTVWTGASCECNASSPFWNSEFEDCDPPPTDCDNTNPTWDVETETCYVGAICNPDTPTWDPATQSCDSGDGSESGSGSVDSDNALGYSKGDKTFNSVLTNFKIELLSTPIFGSLGGFFNLNIQSQQCPVFSQKIMQGFLGQDGFDIVVDQHCSDLMDTLFPIMAAVLMAVASFVAFRWAVL